MTSYDVSDSHEPPRFALTQFTVEEFQQFWPHIEEMLDSVPHTWRYWTKDHIYQSIMNDMIQVWGIGPPPKATFIMMTTVNVHPSMRVFVVLWGAGSFDDGMLPLLDATLTSYAKLNDCDEIEIRGRLGWDGKLRSIGFQRTAIVWSRSVAKQSMN